LTGHKEPLSITKCHRADYPVIQQTTQAGGSPVLYFPNCLLVNRGCNFLARDQQTDKIPRFLSNPVKIADTEAAIWDLHY